MSKLWNDHSYEEKEAIMERVVQVYEQYDNPAWLKTPYASTDIMNVLTSGYQSFKSKIKVEGKCSFEQKGLARAISKDINDAFATVSDAIVEVAYPHGVGDKMCVIENANKVYIGGNAESGSCSIEHKEGQVLLLDFWATWCGPCQEPMAHNQDMLERRGAEWGDKVRLIGLSIDEDQAKLKALIEDKKWTSVDHYHVETPGCSASQDYDVQGVPHVILVDTHGKIAFAGNPYTRQIEQDIDALLKDEVLTVKDSTAGGDDKAEKESPIEGNDNEYPGLFEAIYKFLEESKAFAKAIKPKTEGLLRADLCLVNRSTYNMKSGKWFHKPLMFISLLGKQEAVDAVREEAEKIMKGPWHNECIYEVCDEPQ